MERKRYLVTLACGHTRQTEYPPLGAKYSCHDCGSQPVVSVHDPVTNITTTYTEAPAAAQESAAAATEPEPYTVDLACGHQVRPAKYPMGHTYPCARCRSHSTIVAIACPPAVSP